MNKVSDKSWEVYRNSHLAVKGVPVVPSFEIFNESEFVIKAILPQFCSREVELKLVDNTLTIRGERTKIINDPEPNFNSFQRTFVLPKSINPQDIKSKFLNDELVVKFPKSM